MAYISDKLSDFSNKDSGYNISSDTSRNPIFKIRYDSENLSNLQQGSLSNFVRGQFSLEVSPKEIFIVGDFFDRNGNKQNAIKFLLSGLKLINVFNYFSSFSGIGIRIETSNLDFIFQNNFSYEVVYNNGWYYLYTTSSTSSFSTDGNRYGFRSAMLGATTFNPQSYYDLFYTSPDIDSEIPSEFKNSIGGYVRDTSVFGNGKLLENVYQDSISLKLENDTLYEDLNNLEIGHIIEVIITDEVMSIEFVNKDSYQLSFNILSRGLYNSPIQCHMHGSNIKRTDNSDIFNFTLDDTGEDFFQYRCLALSINASDGNFVCSNLKSRFEWVHSIYSTFDYGFEIPALEKFIISGLTGSNVMIQANDSLIGLFESNYNGEIFSTTFLNGLPVTLRLMNGETHKRYIVSYNIATKQINLDRPISSIISSADTISFGPSPSVISQNGIRMNETKSDLFSGYMRDNVDTPHNITGDGMFPHRKLEIRTSDTFYIWIKHIVKNNNMNNFTQKLIVNFDCEVN